MAIASARPNRKDLDLLADLLQSGKVKPVMDRRYPLNGVPEAIRHLVDGHPRGKVVIQVQPDAVASRG